MSRELIGHGLVRNMSSNPSFTTNQVGQRGAAGAELVQEAT
jgi:hypothetical protein